MPNTPRNVEKQDRPESEAGKVPTQDECRTVAEPPATRNQTLVSDDEIDLFALFQALWRQRLLILGMTVFALVIAGVYIYAATPLYRVTMQVRPGITGYVEGKPIRSWKVADIKSWIANGQYRTFLLDSQAGKRELPEIKATSQKNQDLVLISLYTPNPKEGERLLSELFSGWVSFYVDRGRDPDIRLNLEKIRQQIASKKAELQVLDEIKTKQIEMQKAEYQRQIKTLKNNISLLNQRRAANQNALDRLLEQIDTTHQNTGELVKLRNALLEKKQAQDLSLLLYTNIIQQNIYYVSQLQERVADLQNSIIQDKQEKLNMNSLIQYYKQAVEEENLKLKQASIQERQEILSQIEELERKREAISPVELISDPISSRHPARPRKVLIMAAAIVAGFLVAIIVAFFRAAWQSRSRFA